MSKAWAENENGDYAWEFGVTMAQAKRKALKKCNSLANKKNNLPCKITSLNEYNIEISENTDPRLVERITGKKKTIIAKAEPTSKSKKKVIKKSDKVEKTNQKKKIINKISFCKLKDNYRIIKKEKCIGSFKRITQEDYVIGYLALSGDNLKKSQNQLNRLKKQFKSNDIDFALINKTIEQNSNLKIYAKLLESQKTIKIEKKNIVNTPKKIIKKKIQTNNENVVKKKNFSMGKKCSHCNRKRKKFLL